MPTSSPDGCYYNGTWYPDRDMAAPSVGRILFETFVPEVPSVFELHAGLTPGLLFGPIHSQDEDLYDIRQRFVCTADAGGRLNLPIGRVRLFIDFTYHYYLTAVSMRGYRALTGCLVRRTARLSASAAALS